MTDPNDFSDVNEQPEVETTAEFLADTLDRVQQSTSHVTPAYLQNRLQQILDGHGPDLPDDPAEDADDHLEHTASAALCGEPGIGECVEQAKSETSFFSQVAFASDHWLNASGVVSAAQHEAEEIIADARDVADRTIADAQQQAAEMLAEAQRTRAERERELAEAQRMTAETKSMVANIRRMFIEHKELLAQAQKMATEHERLLAQRMAAEADKAWGMTQHTARLDPEKLSLQTSRLLSGMVAACAQRLGFQRSTSPRSERSSRRGKRDELQTSVEECRHGVIGEPSCNSGSWLYRMYFHETSDASLGVVDSNAHPASERVLLVDGQVGRAGPPAFPSASMNLFTTEGGVDDGLGESWNTILYTAPENPVVADWIRACPRVINEAVETQSQVDQAGDLSCVTDAT